MLGIHAYLFMRRLLTFGWLGNYGAKVRCIQLEEGGIVGL